MSDTGIQVEVVATAEGLDALRPEWEAIQNSSPHRHVMMDHRWVAGWWRHLGRGKELHTLVFRRGGRAVGIAPLVLSRGFELFPASDSFVQIADDYRHTRIPRACRLVPIRRLTFPLCFASANRRCQLLLTEHGTGVHEALMRHLESIADRWDLLVLEGLPQATRQAKELLECAARSKLHDDGRRYRRELAFSDLPHSMTEYLAHHSWRFRRNLKAECRKAEERLGGLTFREYRGAEIDRGIDLVFELEARSWKVTPDRRRRFYVVLDDALRAFHRDVARAFAATDEAQVLVLEAGGRPVTAMYCVERAGMVTGVLTYMDEEFARSGTTAPMFREFIDRCIRRGLDAIDFNGNTTHLRKWSKEVRVYERVMLYSPRPYPSCLWMLSRGAQAVGALAARIRRGHAARSELSG